ncbi:MAG: D-aspartate ligase [Bradyrhizobium sp.]|jgi:predicted ATP-grasp superfamily ATP-dependent carboligase|nr:D-aspartate ligase [Bradyrhizobium sp.]
MRRSSSFSHLSQAAICPVVVVGGSVAGLGVVRSLSSTGAAMTVLDTSRFNAALWSRHCEGRVIASLSGSQLIDELKVTGSHFAQRPLLVLTQDATVEAVSRWRNDLEPYYRFLLPPPDIVEIFNDKGEFHDFAMREKFSVPESVVVRCIDDLVRVEALRLPVIVKPGRKTDLQESGLDRAARFDRLEDATAHCMALMKLKASAIVQEWVDGPDNQIFFCLFFCDLSGQPLRFFTGRKLSAYPAGVGSTATCIAAPEAHAELKALTVRLTSMTRYAGIGGLEFKRDARTGKFFIIEPTVGRTDWQEEIATLSGVNIPAAAWMHAMGRSIEPVEAASIGSAWRTSLKHRSPPALRKANLRIVDGYWRADDPIPGLIFYGVEPVRRMVHHNIRSALIHSLRWLFNTARKLRARWRTTPAQT